MKRLLVLTAALLFLAFGCAPTADITVSRESAETRMTEREEGRLTVLINKSSGKYHLDVSCVYAVRMAEENRLLIEVPDVEYLSEHGYEPCSRCSDEKERNP